MTSLRIYLVILAFVLIFLIGTGTAIPEDKLKEVRAKHEKELFDLGDVSAVSHDETTGEIIVYVEKPEHEKKIPKKLDDVPVRVEVIGKIYALKPSITTTPLVICNEYPCVRTAQFPILIGGISVGNAKFSSSAGTLGVVATKEGKPVILSNAHVLAMDKSARFVSLGTPVWQPGGYDGGSTGTTVGALQQYIPISFNNYFASNYADAAIASIKDDVPYQTWTVLNDANSGYSVISGVSGDYINGFKVWKSGRTTGVNYGTVTNSVATVKVYYTTSRFAYFRDQIFATPMSQPGDSGSAVWITFSDKYYFVGLLFAGSDQITVICKDKYIRDPVKGLGIQ